MHRVRYTNGMRTKDTTRRDLFHSSSGLLVLAILADGPAHGYAIQKQLQQSLSQFLSAGSLYPLMHRLEAEGWITSTDSARHGRKRKTYRLTPEGQQHLKHSAAVWQAAIAQLQSVVLPAVRRVASKK